MAVPLRVQHSKRCGTQWRIGGRDGSDIWLDGCAGLGQARTFSTPEAQYEQLPCTHTNGIAFTAAARVDIRAELIADLRIRQSSNAKRESAIFDSDLLLHAYLRWGEDTPKHIFGDWAFAVWHPNERKLFLARDHFGNTPLYYYADARVFAFASDRRSLLALSLAPMEMDELYLAQVLIAWPAYHGERTIYKQIRFSGIWCGSGGVVEFDTGSALCNTVRVQREWSSSGTSPFITETVAASELAEFEGCSMDIVHLTQLLGLPEFVVTGYTFQEDGSILLDVKHRHKVAVCPQCGRISTEVFEYEERIVRDCSVFDRQCGRVSTEVFE